MTIEALSALGSIATGATEAATSTRSVGALGATSATQGTDFASVLANVAAEGVQTMRAGEVAALGGMQGKTSVQEVVQAVMSAEQTLQAAIAIRDKVVSAYQEISRMAM
jgi:flagellar hook-basal body complex protein FliE